MGCIAFGEKSVSTLSSRPSTGVGEVGANLSSNASTKTSISSSFDIPLFLSMDVDRHALVRNERPSWTWEFENVGVEEG